MNGQVDTELERFIDLNKDRTNDFHVEIVKEGCRDNLLVFSQEKDFNLSGFLDGGDVNYHVQIFDKCNYIKEFYFGTAWADTPSFLPHELHNKITLLETLNHYKQDIPFYAKFHFAFEMGLLRDVVKLELLFPKEYENEKEEIIDHVHGKYKPYPRNSIMRKDIEVSFSDQTDDRVPSYQNLSYGYMYPDNNNVIGHSVYSKNRVGTYYSRYLSKILVEKFAELYGVGQVNVILTPDELSFNIEILSNLNPAQLEQEKNLLLENYPTNIGEIIEHLNLNKVDYVQSYKNGSFLENPNSYENTWENTIFASKPTFK